MYSKLLEQMTIHHQICDKLFSERFSAEKHKDSWNNELYNRYIKSKTRLELLTELVMASLDDAK